ncbi:hypothetical protein [Roseivirga misakiensis]|uniref:Uncharacterized protein n=1 Tax=Roseivirga misakiensis TaxID=1563681 RepID=A0A1E5T503_9BACT|nr:hypothetical protein [Roseivirga misakiensis]OEK06440.1 hypothetical protein BFP71_01825 [Roseivirga misakiensis]
MKTNKSSRNLRYFLAELLILIIGITVSFALNDYRQSKKEEKQEKLLLSSFKADLARDSTVLKFGVDLMDRQIEAAQKIITTDPNTVPIDSLNLNTVTLLSYVPFNPQSITYEEMKSLGNTHIIANDELAKDIIGLYEASYANIAEWSSIDGDHVKNKLINYTINNFPFALNLNFASLSPQDQRELVKSIDKDEFKHIVQWGLIYKNATKATFDSALVSVRSIIETIDKSIEE